MKISGLNKVLLARGFEPLKTVEILADAGYDCIDYSLFNEKAIDDAYAQAKDLKAYAESRGVYFNQSHAPFPTSCGDKDDEHRFELVVKAMETASMLGVRNIVVHPNHHLTYRDNVEAIKKLNYDFYNRLLPFAEKYNINIAIENMWQTIPGVKKIVHSACSRPEEFREYLDMLNNDRFVACLDIGHCSTVYEDPVRFIKMLGKKRLKALHIHDADFIGDLHTLPGWGKINYDEVMKALAEIGYDGELTHEAHSFYTGCEDDFVPEAEKFMATRMRYLANKYFNY